jgi:hypothetical protein
LRKNLTGFPARHPFQRGQSLLANIATRSPPIFSVFRRAALEKFPLGVLSRQPLPVAILVPRGTFFVQDRLSGTPSCFTCQRPQRYYAEACGGLIGGGRGCPQMALDRCRCFPPSPPNFSNDLVEVTRATAQLGSEEAARRRAVAGLRPWHCVNGV